jgi:signal transduction histidine kinase
MTVMDSEIESVRRDLLDQYESALTSHLSGSGGEVALVQAYEIGRRAVAAGLGVLELVDIHQEATFAVLHAVGWRKGSEEAVRATNQFLQETLSAYEVTHLGFKEATEIVLRSLQFEAVVCHELKTPLTSILASAGMLKEILDAEGLDPSSPSAKLLNNILDGGNKLKERTDDLMDIVGFRTGTLTLRMARIAIGPMVRAACQRMEPALSRAGLSLNVDVAERLPTVMADRGRLEQVVANLLDNALKYGADGKAIDVRAFQRDGWLVIQVHDYGKGISARDQARLFETSFRGKGNRRGVPGLGIGLALCNTIIEAHGGVISVESEAGKGSTFSVSLPTGTERLGKRSML